MSVADASASSPLGAALAGGDPSPARPEVSGRRRRKRQAKLPNPGPYDNATQDLLEVTRLDKFEGARFSLGKVFFPTSAKQMFCQGTVWMGHEKLPEQHSVDFASNLVLGPKHRLGTNWSLSEGRVHGRWQWDIHERVSSKVAFQLSGDKQNNGMTVDLDYKADNSCSALKWMSQGQYQAQHMQSITPSIAVGSDLVHAPGMGTQLKFIGRYKKLSLDQQSGHIVTLEAPLGPEVITAAYVRKLKEGMQLAVEGQYHIAQRASVVQAGMAVNARTFRFQTTVNTSGTVAATCVRSLNEFMQFSLSGEINHTTNESEFGFGFGLNF